jgi:hypothetical protein
LAINSAVLARNMGPFGWAFWENSGLLVGLSGKIVAFWLGFLGKYSPSFKNCLGFLFTAPYFLWLALAFF